MLIAFGTEKNTNVSDAVRAELAALGHEVIDVGEGLGWAHIGLAVGYTVAAGRAECGVVFCGNGVGVSMAANKVDGVRAALCATPVVARAARRFNDANVVAVGLDVVPPDAAVEIVGAFLTSESDSSESDEIRAITKMLTSPPDDANIHFSP
jgi:ribose 5-phosphate isomerase B